VRGAAAKGLESDGRRSIKQRKCRRNYGTDCSFAFRANKHREIDAYFCRYTGKKKANNQMAWLVTKGQDLSTSELSHAVLTLNHNFWVGDKRKTSIDLLASDDDRAAKLNTDWVSLQPYIHYCMTVRTDAEQAVYKLASLDVDLSVVPECEFKLMNSPSGFPYYKLSFQIEISIQSLLEFSLSVKGVQYGSVTATYT